MSKLPENVLVGVHDCAEELRLFRGRVDKLALKHRNSDPDLMAAFYSLLTICQDLHASISGVVDFIENTKTVR